MLYPDRSKHDHGPHNIESRVIESHVKSFQDNTPHNQTDLLAVHDAERAPYVADGSLCSNAPCHLIGEGVPGFPHPGCSTARVDAYDHIGEPQHGGVDGPMLRFHWETEAAINERATAVRQK